MAPGRCLSLLWAASLNGSPRGGDEIVGEGVPLESPTCLVDETVVEPTNERQVPFVGRAAFVHWQKVVDVAPLPAAVATAKAATSIPALDGPSGAGWDTGRRCAVVQNDVWAVGDEAAPRGVTHELVKHVFGCFAGASQLGSDSCNVESWVANERSDIEHHIDAAASGRATSGWVTTNEIVGVRAVEVRPIEVSVGQVDQCVCSPLSQGPRRLQSVNRVGFRLERSRKDLVACGIELEAPTAAAEQVGLQGQRAFIEGLGRV